MTPGDEFFEELRREYLAEAPARLGELRKDLAAVAGGEADAAKSLKTRFHRLAGSGGSYGFPEISAQARAAEKLLVDEPTPTGEGLAALERAIGAIAAEFDRASGTVTGTLAAPETPAAFGWRALVIGDDPRLLDQAEGALRSAGYDVARRLPGPDPTAVPASERPELVVILGADPAAIRRWSASGQTPAALVVVGEAGGFHPLAPAAREVTAVLAPDRVESDLADLAAAVGRIGTAPRAILIIDPDRSAPGPLVNALEGGGATTKVVGTAALARDALAGGGWDAIVVERALPDAASPALIRWIRRQPSGRATPIVVVGLESSDDERLALIRAGADEIAVKPLAASYLARAIRARIDRSRAVRLSAHRDDLTGVLNHEALEEELGRAVSAARRANESVAFLVFDVDHLRRINEGLGSAAGDAVLVHVARTLASTVRASDLVGRLGAEEFGAIMRRCRPDDAVRVADKVRTAVAAIPAMLGETPIPVRVSGGIACYPANGASADLVRRAAEAGLAAAKKAGRDRVVAG